MSPEERREWEESLLAKGELQERIRNLRREAESNPEMEEAARLAAWRRHDPQRISLAPGNELVFPEEWPPDSVDAKLEVQEFIESHLGFRGILGEERS